MDHKPVLLGEALRQLEIKADGVYIDCTFGRGGHSRAILDQLGSHGKLLAFDRDIAAIESLHAKKLQEDDRFILKHCAFSGLSAIAGEYGLLGKVDGILLDLGVSSPQLDNPERGFSFMQDGPLDMRMDNTAGMSAAEWLAQVDEKTLADVLYQYGEERFSRRIARAIVSTRVERPITTTADLARLIDSAIPKKDRHKHPATRSFQGIRIAINRELDELRAALEQSLMVLKKGGRLVVISFHSLEDRIVKQFIRDESGAKHDPGRLPIKQENIAKGVLIKCGKPLIATTDEQEQNPRSRSAIMRVAERA